MQILKKILGFLKSILVFINNHFKALLFILIIYLLFFNDTKDSLKNPNLAQIDLKGAIVDFSLLQEIDKIAKDDDIKGVLLNIDSPGGALSQSVEISMAIKNLNAIKPVVVYASGTMASGSYLSGIWTKEIWANPGSFIGSIGVIMQGVNLQNLMQKIGIDEQTVSAGEFKQAGTMTRKWSDSERQSLQNLVDKSYDLFTSQVAQARNLDLNETKIWANARVFLAEDAAKLGLIDGVSNYFETKKRVEKISGVENPVWKEKNSYEKFIDEISKQSSKLLINILNTKIY